MRGVAGTGAGDGTGGFLDALRVRREQDAPAEFALMAAMYSWITPCSTSFDGGVRLRRRRVTR